MKYFTYSPGEDTFLIEEHKKGTPWKEIAEKMERSIHSVRTRLWRIKGTYAKYNSNNPVRIKWTREAIEKIAKLAEEGKSGREIAEVFQVKKELIYPICYYYRISLRGRPGPRKGEGIYYGKRRTAEEKRANRARNARRRYYHERGLEIPGPPKRYRRNVHNEMAQSAE